MKQSGHLNPSAETRTGCPVTSKYRRTLQTSMVVWVDNNNCMAFLKSNVAMLKLKELLVNIQLDDIYVKAKMQ